MEKEKLTLVKIVLNKDSGLVVDSNIFDIIGRNKGCVIIDDENLSRINILEEGDTVYDLIDYLEKPSIDYNRVVLGSEIIVKLYSIKGVDEVIERVKKIIFKEMTGKINHYKNLIDKIL